MYCKICTDKNNKTVVIRTTQYHGKMKNLLNDNI